MNLTKEEKKYTNTDSRSYFNKKTIGFLKSHF